MPEPYEKTVDFTVLLPKACLCRPQTCENICNRIVPVSGKMIFIPYKERGVCEDENRRIDHGPYHVPLLRGN
jgi:hypothetical protein